MKEHAGLNINYGKLTMRMPLLYLLLICCVVGFAAESDRPRGKNCALSAPPANAGEETNHGMTLRVFPRARDIDNQYTGCQTMWMPNGNKWIPIAMVAIENGDAVRLWASDNSNPALFRCKYKKGRVVEGDEQNCAAPQFLIKKSLAPGCVEKIRQAVAQFGLGAPRPQGCEYE
jgi:hypothetical protein